MKKVLWMITVLLFGSGAHAHEQLTPEPRAGQFGLNDPGSDFIFVPLSLLR